MKKRFLSLKTSMSWTLLGKLTWFSHLDTEITNSTKHIYNLIWQIRYPVLLTPAEKEMARKVCIAFRQSVCYMNVITAYDTMLFYIMFDYLLNRFSGSLFVQFVVNILFDSVILYIVFIYPLIRPIRFIIIYLNSLMIVLLFHFLK